ncbi:MAG: chorismate mutase, partial [Erysipelotrichaceae bacterium]|nr:chorismate mutase [Erysipelotrichaceae bacterium]
MNQLEEARVIINEVDKEMASLFEKRMKAVKEVIAYKMENDLPIYDESREKIVVEKNKEYIQDKELV